MSEIGKNFWQNKSLIEMTLTEWEALCDGCGKCCFRKYLDEEDNLYYTRIACNRLNLQTGQCKHYANRFRKEKDCTKLTKENLADFTWLPKTCAYRLLYEGKPLFDWHPLIAGNKDKMREANIFISNGIHEREVIDWFEFVIDEP